MSKITIERFQAEYYEAIAKCNTNGNSDFFIEFMLDMIDRVLDDVILQVSKANAETSEYVKKMLDLMEYDVSLHSEQYHGEAGIEVKGNASKKLFESCDGIRAYQNDFA